MSNQTRGTRNSKKNQQIRFAIIVITIVTIATITGISIKECQTSCGHITTGNTITEQENCKGKAVQWCTDQVAILVHPNAVDLLPKLDTVLNVYQPYTPELIYQGTSFEAAPASIHIKWGTYNMVSANAPLEDRWGYTDLYWSNDGCIGEAKIILDPNMERETEKVLCHELGHSMGLLHSSSSWSIMHSPPGGMTCHLESREQRILDKLYDEQL